MTIKNRRLLLLFFVILIALFTIQSTIADFETNPPIISDFQFEETGHTLTYGNTLHISAIITDESKIASADVCILRGDEGSCLGIDLEYNNSRSRWEGSYTITTNNKTGNYYIFEVDAYDIYGNQASIFPRENHTFSINESSSDTTEPAISDFILEENGQVLKAGDTLHLSAIIIDESEIESADVCILRGDEGSCLGIDLEYNDNTRRWEGSYTITNKNKTGNYYIFEVDAFDIYGNRASIFPRENHTFSINEAVTDTTKPEISNFIFEENGQILKVGDILHISAIITDESEIASADVCILRGDEGSCLGIDLEYDNSTSRWEGTYTITTNNRTGNYYIFEVDAYDIYGNRASIFPRESHTFVLDIIIPPTTTPTPIPTNTSTSTQDVLYYNIEDEQIIICTG